MNTLNPLSYKQEDIPHASDKGAFPYRTVAEESPAAQPLAGVDRMKQLETMLQEAQGRAEIIEKEAYDKAYLAGEKAGMALGKKRAEQLLESIQETLIDTEKSIEEMKQGFAEAAVDVAQQIAEHILGQALEHDTSKLWDVAQLAIAQLPDTSGLRIAVSEEDFATFKRLLDESESLLTLSSDSSQPPATCRIISSQQDILIDPVSAVASFMEQVRPALLSKSLPESESQIEVEAKAEVATEAATVEVDAESETEADDGSES